MSEDESCPAAAPDPDAFAREVREALAVLSNAASLLALNRDEATVEAVRRMLARQVQRLAAAADRADAAVRSSHTEPA